MFADWESHQYCYLTTIGRVTGKPHTIEIWFVELEGSAWLLTEPDGATDWVRNLRRQPRVTLRVGDKECSARAHVVELPSDSSVRRAVFERYRSIDSELDEWASSALVVRVTPET